MSSERYCVYLTIYSGGKLPPFYIGFCLLSRIEKNYHGSVSSQKYKDLWQKELIEHPELFKTKILKKFKNKNEAASCENKFQKHFNVQKNPMYINMSNFPHFAPEKLSLKHKQAISKALTGKKKSASHVEKMSKVFSIKYPKGTGTFLGKKHTHKTIAKIRKARAKQITTDETKRKCQYIEQEKFGLTIQFLKN